MKTITFLFFVFIFTAKIFGQSHFLEFGPHAGITSSKLSTSIIKYTEQSKSGIMGGLFCRLNLCGFYIQPEGNFMIKGGNRRFNWHTIDLPDSLSRICESVKITVIDVPILLGIKIINYELANVRLLIGPVASVLLKHKSNFSRTGNEVELVDYKEDFNDTFWGLELGAGIDMLPLTFDARYEIGINDWSKIPNNETKGSTFLLTLGWKFH
jgi:hypothetical protein